MSQKVHRIKEQGKQGRPWYYQKFSTEEQNQHLRERIRRKGLDLEYKDAQIHELEDEAQGLRDENAGLKRGVHEKW